MIYLNFDTYDSQLVCRDTLEPLYNRYKNKISHVVYQWQMQGIDHNMNTQSALHSLPMRASYGVCFLIIFCKNYRVEEDFAMFVIIPLFPFLTSHPMAHLTDGTKYMLDHINILDRLTH